MALRLPKRIPIRVRTAAALTIPLVLLLVVAGLEVTRSGRERADVREQSELATASIGPAGLINALMDERNYTSLWLFGVEGSIDLPVASMEDAREKTEASLTAFEDEVQRRGGRAQRFYAPAVDALDVLDDNYAAVDGYDGDRHPLADSEVGDQVWATYNRLVTELADATTDLAYEIEDPQLRQGVQLIDMAARQVDRISKIVRYATIEAVRVGGPITDPVDFGLGVQMMTGADREHLKILDLATGPYADLREPLAEESDATGIFGIERRFGESGEVDVAGLLHAVSIEEDESYYGFIHEVSEIVRDRADHLNEAAQADQRRIVALAALLLLGALAAALVVARSITQPLRSLTRQAREMADHRLPDAVRRVHEVPLGQDVVVPELEPVSVRSRDEVGDVADQLNAVQTAALDLAVEQAVLRRNFADVFVNLCRRIQSLLGRQLELISEVQTTEAGRSRPPGSPKALDLTEVSRYAIRLRRHAESLLVLADVESRPTPSEPASLADVVQAALAEVSDADRATVVGVDPVTIAGPAVADLTHLLAELVENALRYTFPEETIEIEGVAGDDGCTLSVSDPGSGLAQHEIDRANRRLAGGEAPTTAPSTYLGQYVTAKLAARHGMSVSLDGTTAGVTATVLLPERLLVEDVVAAPSSDDGTEAPPVGSTTPDAEPAAAPAGRAEEAPAPTNGQVADLPVVSPTGGNDPHPSGPNPALGPLGDGDEVHLDVYDLLSHFPNEDVDRPALATPAPTSPRRPGRPTGSGTPSI